MLTEDQINKLNMLEEKFPKYFPILRDAIETWKQEYVNPIQFNFGIDESHKQPGVFCLNKKGQCCLLGAALVNSKIVSDPLAIVCPSISAKYNVSKHEAQDIYDGFDNNPDVKSEAYDFGSAVSKIVIENK